MKRDYSGPPSPRSCGFRTFTSAAPLKQAIVFGEQLRVAGFRTFTSAAPLKLLLRLYAPVVGFGFRTFTSAAPLKLRSRPCSMRCIRQLPHFHECGPVEATLMQNGDVCEHMASALSRVRPR